MSCTTILVGKAASNDGSTMISRTDDGHFEVKKSVVVQPTDQPKQYKCVISHLEIDLPEEPMRYTASPSVDLSKGIWAASGINAANVGMTATETITSNPRVLAADPLVEYKKAEKEGGEDVPGGIGEEDIVVLVLPYIRTAREGVLRLASLLEKYGTYESNGIAFNDKDEVWWMETIGGHHWIALKVPDDACLIAPNQFGTDIFDLDDALGEQKAYMCSSDLKEFIEENHLDLNRDSVPFNLNPRNIFGSRSDQDHIYNTPRAWFMERYLAPNSYEWDGENAEFSPESDFMPQLLIPELKVSVEDIKYLLSSHYQGTPFDPYSKIDSGKRGLYRPIGINRTGVTHICQIRNDVPEEIAGIEWISYGSPAFSAIIPVYANTTVMPEYLSNVTKEVSTEDFYWASRLLGALADSCFHSCGQHMERYHDHVMTKSRRVIREYDAKMTASGDWSLTDEANQTICSMAKAETTDTLGKVLQTVSEQMKNGYVRSDN